MNDAARAAFVRAHTVLAPVPLVPELVVHTASEVTPLWRATEGWLGREGVAIPFWSVPWAGGQALARWVLDHPAAVAGRRVLDFACGGGVAGIAAARAGARAVRAVDIDPLAIVAAGLNAAANGVALVTSCEDVVGRDPDVDVLLAGDVWYEAEAAARFLPWMRAVAAGGVHVLTGDPGRSYVPARGAREVARYEVPTPLELESAATRTTRVLAIAAATPSAP